MEAPKWTILIPTVGQRNDRFVELINNLMKQVDFFKGDVQVLAYWNNGERPLGEIRESLVEEATGDYISFIDDDDMVPNYYCEKVYNAIADEPDYVGWRMQAWHNGEKLKPTFHSLKYDKWSEDDKGFYRNISHLNPIKRTIANQASFLVDKGVAEDHPWAVRVQPLVHTEVYIDDVMYFYQHNTEDSIWRGDLKPMLNFDRPDINIKYFHYHPESSKGLLDGKPVQ